MDEDSSMGQKTWQVYNFGKRNVFRLYLNKSREWLLFFSLSLLFFFFLLSHHLCQSQRHSSRTARPSIPHLRPHPGLILRCSPTPRGPQEETSDRWWAAIRRRHYTAPKSLRWCSVMPVLIKHMQDTTYCAPY